MGITYRSEQDGALSVAQMDNNFHYLEDQLAGLTNSGSGATGPQGVTGPQGPTGPAGEFNVTGGISFPFLPGNQRTGSGDNLQFEKGSVYQKIISTADGTGSAPTVERLVISGGDSYKNGLTYSGEGGDIYLWAGKGQNGGDIKVDAGEGIESGGTVKIRGGYNTETGTGGFVQIFAGGSNDGTGGNVQLTAGGSNNGTGGNLQLTAGDGYGSGTSGIGGDVFITSGYGSNTGGNITLNAQNGDTAGGDVIITTAGNERMRITNDGKIGIGTVSPQYTLDVNGDVNITGVITSTSSMILKPNSSLSADQYIILDPTEPNQIHIRAGGPIDDSAADLFIGGEDNNLIVSDTTKTVQINSKNLYTQDSASSSVGPNYDSGTWSGNLITITNPDSTLINLINGYHIETDIFTVFYDPTTAVSLNITNKDISNYPTHVLTVDQTAPTASLAITGIDIEIIRYQSGRVIADNGTVTIQTGDTDGPENWVFGTTGSISFPDNSVQTTAYAPKYKVFTALLTQEGTSSFSYTGDSLLKGITFLIDENNGFDFIPYGAPNNNVGTYFICNQDNDDARSVYFNLKYDTGAPIVTVLENTIGNVWFEFLNDGVYAMRSDGLFTIFKTVGFITYNDGGSTILDDKPAFSIYPSNDYNIYVNSALDGLLSNNVFAFTSFEIRVYN